MHVRSHERSVRVIVLQEGDQRGSSRHDLRRRNIHVNHLIRSYDRELAPVAAFHTIVDERTVRAKRFVRLCNDLLFLIVGRQKANFIRRLAVFHDPVRRFDEAIIIDASKGRQRRNQADIGAFGCFNRTKSAIVSVMYVAHFETGPLPGKTARPKS